MTILDSPLTRDDLVTQLPVTVLKSRLQDVPHGLRLPDQPSLVRLSVIRVANDRLRHQEHNSHPQHCQTKNEETSDENCHWKLKLTFSKFQIVYDIRQWEIRKSFKPNM